MTELQIRDLIGAALKGRRILRINYHQYSRLVEPRELAVDQEGQDVLIAWQISGGSDAGPATGRKEFKVSEVIGVVVMSDRFEPDPPPFTNASTR